MQILLVMRALAADIFRAGAGAQQDSFANPRNAQAHRDCYGSQVHPDQRSADVQTRAGADRFHGAGGLHPLPDGGRKGAARLGLRDNVHALQTVQAARRVLHNQGPVEMLAALGGEKAG